MPEPEDALGFGTEQDVCEVTRAETLSRTIDRGKRLLRSNGSVPARGRREAIITVAAGRVIGFAKITEQNLPPARHRLAISE